MTFPSIRIEGTILSGELLAKLDSADKEIEEATSLEMPMLEKHMTILSTLVSLGTLAGLLGTVTGMIKAFGALASTGTPDQAALASGISEALINTATGISTSALAIVMYNFFTSKIDTLTYSIDEAGSAIVKTYMGYRNALLQLETQQQNYSLSQQLLNLVLQKFELKQATIIDVKQAQQSFEDAGYRLVNLSFAAKAAEIELKRITNSLQF